MFVHSKKCSTSSSQYCPKMTQTYSSKFQEGRGHDDCAGESPSVSRFLSLSIVLVSCFAFLPSTKPRPPPFCSLLLPLLLLLLLTLLSNFVRLLFCVYHYSLFFAGNWTNGGYSTGITVHQRFCMTVPSAMPLEHAGPLCCAGITTYTPLARYNLGKSGRTVGIVGFGGLGHIAVKIAVAMGATVTVFSRSDAKKAEAEKLGATLVAYTDAAAMGKLGRTIDHIVDTVSQVHDIAGLINTLKPHTGILTMIGGVPAPYQLGAMGLIFNGTRVEGSLMGGAALTQEMLEFCAKNNIAPDIKIINASQAEGVLKSFDAGTAGPGRNVIDISTIMAVPVAA